MRKLKSIILLLLVATSFAHGQLFTQNYKKLTTEEGLSSNETIDIIQDDNGFIWIGTTNGLNKYDGYKFTVYKTKLNDSTSLPNNTIVSLAQDKKGYIWLATDGGGIAQFNPGTETFKQYTSNLNNTSKATNFYYYKVFVDTKGRIWATHNKGLDLYNPEMDKFENVLNTFSYRQTSFGISTLVEDKNHDLWLATNNLGIIQLDSETFRIKKNIKYNPNNTNSIGSNFVNDLIIDPDGMLWAVHGGAKKNALYKINPVTHKITYYDFTKQGHNDEFYGMLQDAQHNIWMIIENGIKKFDKKTGLLYDLPKNNILQSESILTLLTDDTKSVWISTGNGVLYYPSKKNPFNFTPNIYQDNSYLTKSVDAIYIARDKTIWYGNTLLGLRKIHPKTGKTAYLPELNQFTKELSTTEGITDIIEDKDKNIWITHYYGVVRYNPATNTFKNFKGKFINNYIIGQYNKLYQDSKGLIWAGTYDGWLFVINPETETFEKAFWHYTTDKHKNLKPLPDESINTIYEDESGQLYVGFHLKGLYRLDTKTDKFIKITYQTKTPDTNANHVTSVYRAKDILWIGTANGLFRKDLKTNTTKYYSVQEGLLDNYISAILNDNQGNLWISSNNGISKFNPATNKFTNYESKDGLRQSGFREGSAFKDKTTGILYFGGARGFNSFNPDEIKENTTVPTIAITNFKKHNAEGEFKTIPGINHKSKLELPYNQRDFTIEIAALDYTNSTKNKYAYWLEGYNKNWIDIGKQREITFTNLSPGTYTLKLKGSNNDGIWNKKGRSLQITVLPPWWASWWAISMYALAFIALLNGTYRYRLAQLETVRLKELDEAKRTMYTNITHEFRTPLTVISGINKELKEKVDKKYAKEFDLIDRSSENMLNLVNQLLELRKLEIGKAELNYVQDDVIAYVKYIVESFKVYAQMKNITLYFVCIAEKLVMDYDPEKLLIILSNLLSNAIKYSDKGTDIYFQLDEIGHEIQLRVIDSGPGIAEEELPHIFQRFYKVKQKEDDNVDGVGIGLAVTKELVTLLKGTITVTSRLQKGTIFILTLPITNKAAIAKVHKPEIVKNRLPIEEPEAIETVINFNDEPLEENRLLVIEDNHDIIKYLKVCLAGQWEFKIAKDGEKGIEMALDYIPDVILCDLMMPKLNGYEVLKILKNDTRTSHIPIVILTAKADDDSRLEAYRKGADSFLLKPFNKEELLIILNKLAQQRHMLQERFKIQGSLRFAEGIEIHKEDTFITKLEQLVLQEDSESMYSIANLCADLGMSRTQLHHKIKALTGKSTSIFVRSLRLQKGKYLLENTSKSISEVAYEVGFNHPSYFSKSFTEEFGLSPSSLRK